MGKMWGVRVAADGGDLIGEGGSMYSKQFRGI